MAKKEAQEKQAVMPDGGNIDQIRDILFGKSMKEYEKRFNQLEEHLSSELSLMREESKKMFNTLESYVKEELNSIGKQLKNEAQERGEADTKITAEKDALAKRHSEFEKESTEVHSEIRRQILELTKKTSDELSSARKELMDTLKKTAAELEFRKADRSKMASLLTEMALRLSDETGEDES